MGTPHVHVELIKAWADGAKVQWFKPSLNDWVDIRSPIWNSEIKYRIKPEPKKVQLRFFEDTSGRVRCWTDSWASDLKRAEEMSLFKRWVSPLEEREFYV